MAKVQINFKILQAKNNQGRIQSLIRCKCGLCEHTSKEACINRKCYCCDLEDMFSLLSQQEYKPRIARDGLMPEQAANNKIGL